MAKKELAPDLNFELLSSCESGLYGKVWKGRQINLNRHVAIKILHPSMASALDILDHAKGLAKAGQHPNVVTVHQVAVVMHPETGKPTQAVIMEWLEGKTLETRLLEGLFEKSEAVPICKQMIDGMSHLHGKQLPHGDLHGENVLLVDDHPKIIDIDYSADKSLRLLKTLSREARFSEDVQSLGWLLCRIIRKTNLAASDIAIHELALRRAKSLEELRLVVEAVSGCSEQPRDSKGAVAQNVNDEVAEAISAIENNHTLQEAKTRKYIEWLTMQLSQKNPDLATAPRDELDDRLVAALEASIPLVTAFGRVSQAISDANSSSAGIAMVKAFSGLLEQYNNPPGFSGSSRNIQFDFYKFIGAELFTTFVAALLKLDRWDLLNEVLDTAIYVRNWNRSSPELITFESISEYVELLAYRNERLNLRRITLHGDLLQKRHSESPLVDISPFDDYLAADFFLFLRNDSWQPWSIVYLRHAPRFLLEAKRNTRANQLLSALKIGSVGELKTVVSNRIQQLGNRFRDSFWGRHLDIDVFWGDN